MLDGANRGHARCYPCDLGCLDAACAFQRSTPRATSLQDQRPTVTSLEFSPFRHLIDAHRELHITINSVPNRPGSARLIKTASSRAHLSRGRQAA